MLHYRFLVVVEPFLFLLIDGWVQQPSREGFGFSNRKALLVGCVALMAIQQARGLMVGIPQSNAAGQSWVFSSQHVGSWLRERAKNATVAAGDIGLLGWMTRAGNTQLVDFYGLTDRSIARIPGDHLAKAGPAFQTALWSKDPKYVVLWMKPGCREAMTPSMREIENSPVFRARYRQAFATPEARQPWCVFERD